MTDHLPTPRLTLGHTTLAVRDLDRMVAFYVDVLGFHVTNRARRHPGSPTWCSCRRTRPPITRS